jgi:predicted glutamine amidotransferase
MCELFAFSSSKPTRARFLLNKFRLHGCAKGPHCDGWGVAFYKGKYAQIYREDRPAAYSELMSFLLNHEIYSNCVISHIRKATQGSISLQNTQPFSRESHGVRHLFAHNGNLKDFKESSVFDRYQPIGDTDSEFAFCKLMDSVYSLWNESAPTLEQRIAILAKIFSGWARLGPANVIYSDGEYLFAFANRRTQSDGNIKPPGLYYLRREGEPHRRLNKFAGIELDGSAQAITLFASVPLSKEPWCPFKENELIVCKNGLILKKVGCD